MLFVVLGHCWCVFHVILCCVIVAWCKLRSSCVILCILCVILCSSFIVLGILCSNKCVLGVWEEIQWKLGVQTEPRVK